MNDPIKDGGPAFPSECDAYQIGIEEAKRVPFTGTHPGMSLRDYFAAKAMQAMVGEYLAKGPLNIAETADEAYAFADAMLAEREKPRLPAKPTA